MNSKEALEHIIFEAKLDKPIFSVYYQELIEARGKLEKDLEILECFRKIPKQDLKEFIDWQIRYEKNMNTWLEGCNCDLAKEEPTKHLFKIKEWLENEKNDR